MRIGKSLQLVNPFIDASSLATVSQLEETYKTVNEIVSNLDNASILELSGGNKDDLDGVSDLLLRETYNVLYGSKQLIKDTNLTYFHHLSQSVEKTMRKSNLNYFISSVLQEFLVNWHHLEWGQFVQQYNKLAIIAPRDHGKSYFFSLAVPIWKMYRYGGSKSFGSRSINDSRHHRGYILSNDKDLTIDFLEQIKGTIEENPALREELYNPKSDQWTKTAIRCKNGARLNIKSYGGSFRGRHPGYIIVDDFLKDNVIYSEVQRRKATDYFHSVVMNAVIPGGQVVVVGTPFHQSDLYGDLKDKRGTGGWRVFEYPAITPTGRVLWPSRYTYNDLMEKRESQGNVIFSREILCRPIVNESSIFPWEILRRSISGMESYTLVRNIDSFPRKFSRVITACDLALSAAVGADYSVYTTWGIDDTRREMWLVHFWRGKGKRYEQQLQILKSIHRNFRSDLIIIEANQFQKMFADMADDMDMPVVPHTTTAGNKNDLMNGLPGMAIMFERGRIKFPYGDKYSKDIVDLILGEFGSVAWTDKGIQGVGDHDDCVMSSWLGKRGMEHSGNGSFGMSFLE